MIYSTQTNSDSNDYVKFPRMQKIGRIMEMKRRYFDNKIKTNHTFNQLTIIGGDENTIDPADGGVHESAVAAMR